MSRPAQATPAQAAGQGTGPPPPAPAAPEPQFEVLGARARRHAALPTLEFDVHVTEPTGRGVHFIALTAQVMIEPARRRYEPADHERLVELFGAPERWATTTRSLVWTIASVLVPAFTGATTFQIPIECSYDLEVAAPKYFHGLSGGEVPLAFNFNGTVYYRGEDGRLQMSLVPWSATTDFRMPVAVWKELVEHYYPQSAWVGLSADTLAALQREKARRGAHTFDSCVRDLLDEPS